MNRIILVALAITLGTGTNVALAEGSPELNRPFAQFRTHKAPPSVAVAGPVDNDAEARARLQVDGYRDIILFRGSDGAWHGTATRGSARLSVVVGAGGRVTSR